MAKFQNEPTIVRTAPLMYKLLFAILFAGTMWLTPDSEEGVYKRIKWKDKGISIIRSNVEMLNKSRLVADLPASKKEFVDTVPNTRVYWYWMFIDIDGNQIKRIGPVRARADTSKTTKYASAAKDITLIAQRTQSSVVVAWDLPKEKYKDIVIRRRNRPELPYGRGQRARTIVHGTTERSGDLLDNSLPDQNADYWYWVEATKEDGSVISKGPVKAELGAK